jgi:hypothetical protein
LPGKRSQPVVYSLQFSVMLKGIPYRRSFLLCAVIILCTFFLAECVDHEAGQVQTADRNQITFAEFTGSQACAGCHKDIYASHIHTAHFLTTRPAKKEFIKGSFAPGKNSFAYSPEMEVHMEKRDSGFYQVGYFQDVERIAKRFDIVVGSGSKGQTYITRYKNRLYQLPVSYFTAADKWANSPQFPAHIAVFNRSITSRCLECHTTFAETIPTPEHQPEEFNTDQFIYGVDCEKCHGPGARHVAFQTQNPKETKAKYILNPGRFSRQQILDLCGLCHGGRLQKTKASFSFVAGDSLSSFFKIDSARPDPEKIDVHGNQLGLLRSSKCFIMSGTLTCITCHNSHENERGKIALFSSRCMTCHSSAHGPVCKLTKTMGSAISQNCIDCHMPAKASKSITELLPGETRPTAALIRSHYIAIYPEETRLFKTASKKTH